MIEIDFSRCATVPKEHQKDGVRALLKLATIELGHEVGAGKSKIVIDSSQIMYEAGMIDTVVVACPAFARGVWANPDEQIGEVAKHGWPSVDNYIIEYSVRFPKSLHQDATGPRKHEKWLRWIVTNYEFIRRDERLGPLLVYLANHRFLLACDEAWALKDQNTAQWKAVHKIRCLASRIVLLNGTPIADSPMDLNAQMHLLSPTILGFPYINKRGQRVVSCADYRFREYYAGIKWNADVDTIAKWSNLPMEQRWPRLEELREKVAPYIITKRTRECFDLPPVLEPVLIEAKLGDENWRRYVSMRDQMVAWLNIKDDLTGGTASIAKQAIVKSMRLAQITSGFIGGVQEVGWAEEPDMLDFGTKIDPEERIINVPETMVKEIGTEKLDALITWLERLRPVPDRILIWCRFRLEVERTARLLNGQRRMLMLYGEQSQAERDEAVRLLNPGIPQDGLVGVVGNPLAGGAALNLAGAALAVSLSHDTKLRVYLQARGRIDRPGQKNPIRYVDVVATGPKGQRTIDHHVLAALRGKQDIANWTAATWKSKLMEE